MKTVKECSYDEKSPPPANKCPNISLQDPAPASDSYTMKSCMSELCSQECQKLAATIYRQYNFNFANKFNSDDYNNGNFQSSGYKFNRFFDYSNSFCREYYNNCFDNSNYHYWY
uniref:Uncharacterized protein n=1 Tax=Globodera rostochiensis TaxID=31243 RepID=A0A914IG44_GLORO